MSYRAFKRLLGETSLERKCRFLFGAATLVLIATSFLWYAYKTEDVAYDQAKSMGRLIAYQTLKDHALPAAQRDSARLRTEVLEPLSGNLNYAAEFITARNAVDPDNLLILRELEHSEDAESDFFGSRGEELNYHYRLVLRAKPSCLACHQEQHDPKVQSEGQYMGVLQVRLSTRTLENRMHINRAILITTALVSAILLMLGSYLIVRYVIVKPVKHLKDVSDAISAGELNIRSEIQTGDEFEDLSHAFNRMLRTLVSMQDQLRRVNGDLDRKVDELAQRNMALYQSDQLKSDFLARMSHELRTPLNSILGFSEVLLSSDQLSERQQRWVKNIQVSGQGLLTMINDILDLAKMEAGKMQVRPEEMSIQEVCEGLLNLFRPQAEKKNIAIESRIDPGIPLLHQDPNKLQQILWNLLSNAVKFTPEGGRVSLTAETDGVHLILSVIDTGVGIAPEDQGVIFEKFRQVGTTITREHSGTGLGLSIVRELAKLLGGDVGMKSELGRGSAFTVTLPLRFQTDNVTEVDRTRDGADGLRDDGRLFVANAPRLGEENGDAALRVAP